MGSTTLSIKASNESLRIKELVSNTQKKLQSGNKIKSVLDNEYFISINKNKEINLEESKKIDQNDSNNKESFSLNNIEGKLVALAKKLESTNPEGEAVNLLALQTRQQLAVSPASLAESAEKRIIDLFN